MTRHAFGGWPSPISAETATSSSIGFTDSIQYGDGSVYWLESRPDEGGRSAIVRRTADGEVADFGPSDFNARSRVHEYGGGAFAVADGVVFAAGFEDQRWYRIDGENPPQAITPEPPRPGSVRYADLVVGHGWGIAVRETHPESGEPVNDLVRLDLRGEQEPVLLVEGHDFFAAPRISPDGRTLAWLTWDHPNMPWDGTDLWTADLAADGTLGPPRHVAGGVEESVVQPEWSPDGTLHFVSDRTGWWNIYRVGDTIDPVHPVDADFGWEMWVFGTQRYVFLDDGRIVAAEETTPGNRLWLLDRGEATELSLEFVAIAQLAATGTSIYVVGTAFDAPTRLVEHRIDTGESSEIRAPAPLDVIDGYASVPEPVTFDTPDGPAHALFYPPTHPEFEGPTDEAPPLVVTIHGGPTASTWPALSLERLYWTSRGYGVLDVDYGGSTGYGREYRQRLVGEWGVVDVRDCALAASHVADSGAVDGGRLVIKGGSAGGYTVLMALAQHDVFAAGAARYPVTDLIALASDTHKFESRYLDSLVGPYPEAHDLYVERSPMTHVETIESAVLLLQGLDDRVVPPSQPRAMEEALRRQGRPVGYIEFEGEGHGFRSAGARVRALEAELSFFGGVLGLLPDDDLEQIELSAT